ncbi:hypothetical protein EmuJ_000020400 [Echinococcus multilocularis]|uniref:Uncharacterized protein n=1 Tax=Echinococcus multilocularis TaxID=6211 RepID=A0A087VWN8_ECHMU|nr:hypothetical protein EmuJ_000020400 [Echinococcus multilocularis]
MMRALQMCGSVQPIKERIAWHPRLPFISSWVTPLRLGVAKAPSKTLRNNCVAGVHSITASLQVDCLPSPVWL